MSNSDILYRLSKINILKFVFSVIEINVILILKIINFQRNSIWKYNFILKASVSQALPVWLTQNVDAGN